MSTNPLESADPTRVALAKALVDEFYSRFNEMKNAVDASLRDQHKKTGSAKWNVALDGYGRIGDVAFSRTQAGFKVTDRNAFEAWLEEHRPDAVEYVVKALPESEKAILKSLTPMDDGKGGMPDRKSGEMAEVPGVKYHPGGELKDLRINFEKGTENLPGGKDVALNALYDMFSEAQSMFEQVLELTTGPDHADATTHDACENTNADDATGDIVDADVVEDREDVAA